MTPLYKGRWCNMGKVSMPIQQIWEAKGGAIVLWLSHGRAIVCVPQCLRYNASLLSITPKIISSSMMSKHVFRARQNLLYKKIQNSWRYFYIRYSNGLQNLFCHDIHIRQNCVHQYTLAIHCTVLFCQFC